MDAEIGRDKAVDALAACLYLKMERMDPTGAGPWDYMPEDNKEFYRRAIREILLEKTLLNLASGDSRDSPTTAV